MGRYYSDKYPSKSKESNHVSVNKVILIGRLGKDPELKYTPNGNAVCNFSLATSESYTDKQGAKQDKSEWHRVVVWGKLAELCNQYLIKGSQAYIDGGLQTRSWENKDGNKVYTTEINARVVQFLGGKSDAPVESNTTEETKPVASGGIDMSDIPF